jgi:hypothetical protein
MNLSVLLPEGHFIQGVNSEVKDINTPNSGLSLPSFLKPNVQLKHQKVKLV